jgi:hypothetical protein
MRNYVQLLTLSEQELIQAATQDCMYLTPGDNVFSK